FEEKKKGRQVEYIPVRQKIVFEGKLVEGEQ
ncbi:hypothetical protein B4N84_17470, partial [Flavobacterium sp. IR1]